jgi:hypothetical protein
MYTNSRPDLSNRGILALTLAVILAASIILLWPGLPLPGSPPAQISAAIGTLLLLAPLFFSMMKRSGLSESPPTWFVLHVLSTLIGSCLIYIHVASGQWLTPPGLVLLLLVFLILQGSLLRGLISRGFSLLFANGIAQGFSAPAGLDKAALQKLIDRKSSLLSRLDSNAEEALFSPALRHWLGSPVKSFRYQLLAQQEANMIGARASAGNTLAWSRRIHMLAALAFYLGLISHIIVMLFFAGYAAGGDAIDWWYITDWGR